MGNLSNPYQIITNGYMPSTICYNLLVSFALFLLRFNINGIHDWIVK